MREKIESFKLPAGHSACLHTGGVLNVDPVISSPIPDLIRLVIIYKIVKWGIYSRRFNLVQPTDV